MTENEEISRIDELARELAEEKYWLKKYKSELELTDEWRLYQEQQEGLQSIIDEIIEEVGKK